MSESEANPILSLAALLAAVQEPDPESEAMLVQLIQRGALVGVEIFGSDDCCEHGMHESCPADGFGLCDNFGPHTVGSDCNRAERFLLRPSDACMTDRVLHEITNGDRMTGAAPEPYEPAP